MVLNNAVVPYLKHVAIVLTGILLYFYISQIPDEFNDENPIESKENWADDGVEKVFTAEELTKYDGSANSLGIYLVIMGEVYDVEKGKQHYAPPDGTYQIFVGKDATRAFLTGEFDEYKEELADISGLRGSELLSLTTWKKFYVDTYPYKGKVVGLYYDAEGKETEYLKVVHHKIELAKLEADNKGHRYPSCNVEWKAETGSRFWCTDKSGDGIERGWAGVPRKYKNTTETTPVCVCVPETDLSDEFEAFDNCGPYESSCNVADKNKFINK